MPASAFLVGIAGGSGSGKTSLSTALAAVLGPDRVACLPHDAYYVDHPELDAAARGAANYDAPEALDHALFTAHLRALRAGLPVAPPQYCFATHRRIGTGPVVEPRDIVIAEGILLLHDPDVRQLLDFTVFLDAPEPARLARRVARDTRERGRTPDDVVAQFEATVRAAHRAWVEPTRSVADLVLTSVGPVAPLAEIAAAVIDARLARFARLADGKAA
jgi:uridine kinase